MSGIQKFYSLPLLFVFSAIFDLSSSNAITYDFECSHGCRRKRETANSEDSLTLKENSEYYTQSTMTLSKQDFMKYYKDVKQMIEQNEGVGQTHHPQLADSYRRAVAMDLNFTFPFYDFPTEKVTIATGGFIYVGQHTHSWLAATQYIAPLMANFDTSRSDNSTISFVHTEQMFVVEWKEVPLRTQEESGTFTFECVLWRNGSIWMLYKNLPMNLSKVNDNQHPLKIGLSDAYMESDGSGDFTKKVLFEYDRIEISRTTIKNYTIVMLDPTITCSSHESCASCVSSDHRNGIRCTWCTRTQTNGTDNNIADAQAVCTDSIGIRKWNGQFPSMRCRAKPDCQMLQPFPSSTVSTGSQAKVEKWESSNKNRTTNIVTNANSKKHALKRYSWL